MVPALGGRQITFPLPAVTSALVCVTSSYEGFFWKKTVKHSEIILDLQATKLLMTSEAHHLLVISGVDLGSLKKCYSSAKNDKPLPCFSLFIFRNACMPTGYRI